MTDKAPVTNKIVINRKAASTTTFGNIPVGQFFVCPPCYDVLLQKIATRHLAMEVPYQELALTPKSGLATKRYPHEVVLPVNVTITTNEFEA